MRAMPIVVMDPTLEHVSPLRRMVVGDPIGPLAKGRLDKALRLAVGLRPIGSGKAVSDAQAFTGMVNGPGAESPAIVGEYASHTHAQGTEVGNGVMQELCCAGPVLLAIEVGEANTRMIIYGHKQILPTCPAYASGAVPVDTMACALDSGELLDVDMNELSRIGMLVADHRLAGFEVLESRQPRTRQHPSNGALGHAQAGRDSSLDEPAPAQLHDRHCLTGRDRPRAQVWARGAIMQSGLAFGQ